MWAVLATLAFALQTPSEGGAAPEPVTAAMAQANKARVATRPVYKSGPSPDIPEAVRATGAHGKVVVSGVIGADGRFTETKVAVSSRSSLLDAAALEQVSAMIFEPARDAEGVALSLPARTPLEFTNAKSEGKGGGVLRYGCSQFARDYDWWYATWPATEHDDFYYLVLGLSALSTASASGRFDVASFGKGYEGFEPRWKAAVEACRKAPQRLFIDVFKPEGDFLRRGAAGR
ncbi:TonB family protein [Phenylobacterium sp. 20VBR1]|uniref:TonB family protein n=1 Tax=Phenylobacterium glaciei TaxID=2803784 RepID=A0A941D3F4_9CAUL|nr:TonB family protein [Phenylobacterium glaciei]MBR7620874.1 TonB family protein [Phenylobacterium glaciei]QQZ49625.1 TonB family protein [Phenylobacterium glaciei]